MEERLVPARTGYAFEMAKGARFRIVDIEGNQISDLVAFLSADRNERTSPGNTRKLNSTICLTTGGILYSTKCRGLLEITEDTVGEHDLLFSSCSEYDYRVRFGLTTPHASCLSILKDAVEPWGLVEHQIPDPLNVFQRTVIKPDRSIETVEGFSKAGDFIEFEAMEDCLVALSTCPQDQNPANGWKITDLKVVHM